MKKKSEFGLDYDFNNQGFCLDVDNAVAIPVVFVCTGFFDVNCDVAVQEQWRLEK